MSENGDLLTREEAAAALAVRPGTLAAWASRGSYALPYIKVGKSVRYRRRDVEAFLRRRTIRPGDTARMVRNRGRQLAGGRGA